MDIINFKKNIYEESQIKNILLSLGCHSIKEEQNGKIITAGLPGGDNKRSVQIKNNPYFNASIRSKGIIGIDLFDIVSYIKFNENTREDMKYSRTMSINWVKRILNMELKDYSSLDWVQEIKKEITNTPLDKKVLNRFINLPHKEWIKEGISYDTQMFFNIAYNLDGNQIVIPIYNKDNELIGVKARNLDLNKTDKKYVYIYPCNASANLYGLNIAKKHMQKNNELILFESEKSVMKSFQYGLRNTVALGCSNITITQINLIKEMINDSSKIILAFDKDVYYKNKKFNFEHLKEIDSLFKNNSLYTIIDDQNLTENKDAPVDKGEGVFKKLLKDMKLVKDLNEKDYNNKKEDLND